MTATAPRRKTTTPIAAESLTVPKLIVQAEQIKTTGRKRKRKAPAPPKEILDAMTDVEREYFDVWVEDQKERFPDLIPADHIILYLAGFELVQLLRMHLKQMIDGELISQARQHPGVQFRQYMDMLALTRKQRPAEKQKDIGQEILEQMLGTSD